MRTRNLLATALIIFLAACTSSPVTQSLPAASPQPTQPPPTSTPSPTATVRPTNTPRPTPTPRPTTPPTPAPEPWTLTGSGDSVADLGHACLPAVAHITGNTAGDYFGVTNLDANNETINLLVNTTDPYDGYRPLDWPKDECTTRFQISAAGDWTIEILPIAHIAQDPAWYLTVPGTREGTGDAILLIQGTPDTAKITGNAAGRYFAVVGWGARKDLLVNEVEPYEGTVLLDKRTIALEIQATGPWTISTK